MSLFSKFTKNNAGDKTGIYPWSQRKLIGSQSHVLPRFGHATAAALPTDNLILFGGMHNKSKKDLFLIDTNNMSANFVNATGDVPTPRMHPVIAPLGNNCVLLYGGEPSNADEKWDPNFYTLNISTRQWSRIQMKDGCLPVERSGHSIAVGGNLLYIWGGQRAGRYLDDLFVLNASTYQTNPQWEHIASANEGPAGRSGHASVVFDDKVYIFGGTDGDHLYNDVWAYDLHTRHWSQISAVGYIPVPREGCDAALAGDVMYVFGGRGPDGHELGDLCAFKIRGHRWFMFQNMGPSPTPRFGLTFTAVDDKIVALGGESSTGKMEESPYLVHILDCSKIRYPPETQTASNPSPATSVDTNPAIIIPKSSVERLQQIPQQTSPGPNMEESLSARDYVDNISNATATPATAHNNIPTQNTTSTTPAVNNTSRRRSLHPEQTNMVPQRPPRHMSMVPPGALRRPRTTSPLPLTGDDNMQQQHNEQLGPTKEDEKPRSASPARNPSPQRPPRPSREGVSLGNTYRKDTVSMFPDSHIATTAAANVPFDVLPTEQDESELESLMKEVKAQDVIIHSMKKKEPWWRSEVSMARKMRLQDTSPRDEPMASNALVEEIMALKAELRRTQAHISDSTMHQAMATKVQQTDRIRTAALQEAAYFKSKYIGLMERRRQQGDQHADDDQVQVLEQRLAETLMENETTRRLLQQRNKQAHHDHNARDSAEDRAKEAQERAEEAHRAHERALEKLDHVHQRAVQAEAQVRENVDKVASLTNQLADSLSAPSSKQMDQAKDQIIQLEQANSKVYDEAQVLRQQLGSYTEDIQHLRLALDEREDALGQAMRQLEDTSVQVSTMKQTLSKQTPAVAATASPTRAY
ncbi:hypothetical protein BDB00DRAFT_824491 [Zychaea mexicana]|uniref:uncharacterized protein n=1 Tax=Zychaea mexicana TaxID=64656 RepID=UPI0022FE1EE4|nr:uncharacterized protein BDB00DRAFT_824491 [Zychaea mexicana]KAI9493120.1 hypothetical protein BDB00DRAFT_824491 [Zychaea mexicana]